MKSTMKSNNHSDKELIDAANTIFLAGVERVNPRQLICEKIELVGEMLNVLNSKEIIFSINISKFKKIKILGLGKASVSMGLGILDIFPDVCEGLLVTKDLSENIFKNHIKVILGSHPIPDEKSLEAGRLVLDFCTNCSDSDLVIGLISGGASALVEIPVDGVSLSDLIKTTEILLKSGANIQEINSIRKHLSQLKGGKLAAALGPATSLNLILSDVVGNDLSVIASGPTVLNDSTYKDAWSVVEKYDMTQCLPKNVIDYLRKGLAEKIGEPVLSDTHNFIIGSNLDALVAAQSKAVALGFETLIISSEIEGEANSIAAFFVKQLTNSKWNGEGKPKCIIAGGESTVKVKGSGKGGRNQEMALSFLDELIHKDMPLNPFVFLSAATDGGDGPTEVAGAYVTKDLLQKVRDLKLNSHEYLSNNDSYHFFQAINGAFYTGATGTNVCDIQILICT